MEEYILRSILYVPAYSKKFMEKSLSASADGIIYDLEDSVPEAFKADARENLRSYLASGVLRGKTVFVRLNDRESGQLPLDMEAIIGGDVTGLIPSKINTAEEIEYYDELLAKREAENGMEPGCLKLLPLIETTGAVLDIVRICKASARIIGVCLGGEDFLNDLNGIHGEPPISLHYPRAVVAAAARAAGILPIDTPYLAVHDEAGFLKEEEISFQMGFAGIQILSPVQIPLAHRCFTPAIDEVTHSREILKAWEKAACEGSGVAMYQGKMIGPPMRKKAERILKYMERIERHEQNLP